ncbi:diguanylate cyclase [Neobacillus sp. PS2-9]|uniref:GGDEF domain-containing protein n=1 Tax=Neobacillus sp. PS2-9 TaxID=3070676 RepID=UPI0027DFE1D8|nr:diguanylate cyclase [Neobacillus sp. PS2-9]WML58815.1 diguanylate cyclase [Neobacillus sp. PS2-9]
MITIKEYLVNAAMIISIIYLSSFIHKHLLVNMKKGLKTLFFAVVAIFTGWCSMFFGIHLNDSVIFDLRFVPIIIAALHYRTPLTMLAIGVGIGLLRLSFGVNTAAIVGFMNMVVLSLSAILLIRISKNWGHYKKVLFIVLMLNLLNTIITMIFGVISVKNYLLLILPTALPMNILFSLLLLWIVKDLKNEYIHKIELWNRANKDPLTKAYNRRAFKHFYQEYVFEKKETYPLSLAFIDIDHFKRVNDTYGHLVGDVILEKVSGLVSDHIRDADILARYGGEEFVVILPSCTKEQGISVMEGIRQTIENHPFLVNDLTIHITLSVGMASTETTPPKHLLKTADDAVYQAKENGRNLVQYGDSPPLR